MTSPIHTTDDGGYPVREISVDANRVPVNTSIDDNRRPFPQVNGFRPWVRAEFDRRRKEWPTPIVTPFVRMTSCNEDIQNSYKYFSLGLHGFDNEDVNIFGATYGGQSDVVGYARDGNGRKILIGSDEITFMPPNIHSYNDASDETRANIDARTGAAQQQQSIKTADGAHPVPGITSVDVQRSGLQNPFQATVHWQCYNQQQLEFLRNHFMTIGSYIVIEWGQKSSTSKDTTSTYLDFGNGEIMDKLVNTIIKGRSYVIDNYIRPNKGAYDYIVGQVGNFTIDFDPSLNIYKCSTKIVSMGENMWGLGLSSTATIITEEVNNDVSKIVDVHTYFERGGGYDALLDAIQTDPTRYCRPVTDSEWFDKQKDHNLISSGTLAALADMGNNPGDNVFISWTTFTRDIMNDMIGMFESAMAIRNDKNDSVVIAMYDKLRADLTALLDLGGPPREELAGSVKTEQQRLYELEWVGNHPTLRTVDPNTLVIITSALLPFASKEWQNGGMFGDERIFDGTPNGRPAPEYLGKLTKGVWLNVEMIRREFLQATTLQQAIQSILNKMNVATAHYWQLRLYYDDEIGVYKVIDYKFDHDTDRVPMYVFNSNRNEQHNETVDIKFDTAFPPELITQMMVVSMIQTSSPAEQKGLFERYPLINNTSPFMFAVNWTSLDDILKREVGKKRKSLTGDMTSRQTQVISPGNDPTQASSLPGSALVGDINNKSSMRGKNAKAVEQPGVPRTNPDSPPTTPSQKSAGLTAPAPNKTALPPQKIETFQLKAYPVYPIAVSSAKGNRTAPIEGASQKHGGIDLLAAEGTAVRAGAPGTLIYSGFTKDDLGLVKIQHDSFYSTEYLHLSAVKFDTNADSSIRSRKISAGDIIGYSGGRPHIHGTGKRKNPVTGEHTPMSTGPHLHFEVRKLGVSQDPQKYLDDLARRNNEALPQTYAELYSGVGPAAEDAQNEDAQASLKTAKKPTATEQRLQELAGAYAIKFGNNIGVLMWLNASNMRNMITTHGYRNLSNKLVNSFISPFPTKTSVEVKVPGMAGISISDAFMVDKLPFIFASYGAFQTTTITDSISTNGWYTNIRGYFKMMWPEGSGGMRVE